MIHPEPGPRETSLTLREFGDSLRRGKGLILGTTLLTIAAAAALTAVIPRTYESQASVQILEEDAAGGFLQELGPLAALGIPGIGDSEIDTDISVIRSRRIVEAVVDSLGLHIQLRRPDELRSEVLHVLGGSAEAVPGSYTLRRTNDGGYELSAARVRIAPREYTRSMPRVREIVRPPARIEIGQPFAMGGVVLRLADELRMNPPDEIRYRVRPFQEYVRRLREKDLRVRRLDRGQLLLLEYRYTDPELAAAAVNFLTEHFIDYKLSTSTTESRTRVEVLREQVVTYEQQIRDVERLLQSFQERELIVAPEEQATQQVRRVAEMQVIRDAAVVEREALQRVLAEVSAGARIDEESPYRKLATFPSFIANGAVQDLLQALLELEGRRSELLLLRQPTNEDVRSLTERIGELELRLLRLARDYAESLDSQIAAADGSLSQFAGELATMPSREIEYARLTRERVLLSEVYVTLQQRLKEAEVMAAVEAATGSVRVVDTGIVPERPVFPNPPVNLALGAVLGLMLGMMAVVARESMSSRIRSPADAATLGSGVPVLGSIPRLTASGNGRGPGGGVRLPGLPGVGARRTRSSSLVVRELPASQASDAFRALRTNITYAHPGPSPQVLVVTSPARGEGKSLSVSNLAVTLAQQGARTLLIDGDLRTGRLHRLFGVNREPGMVDVLAGNTDLRACVHSIGMGDNGTSLEFLASGAPPLDPSHLLDSASAGRFFEQARGLYDSILIDAPALESGSDAALLGRLADATVLVVRAGTTEREALTEAVARLQRLRVHVAGVVLNDA